jgi:hypothetical protein
VRVPLVASTDHQMCWIARDLGIWRQDRHAGHDRLGHQHPVEWVAMNVGKPPHREGCAFVQRQGCYRVEVALLRYEGCRWFWKR